MLLTGGFLIYYYILVHSFVHLQLSEKNIVYKIRNQSEWEQKKKLITNIFLKRNMFLTEKALFFKQNQIDENKGSLSQQQISS